jgi:hypothetical protein
MKKVRIDEVAIGKAIQRYLEDLGYIVHNLQMVHDGKTNEFSAVATVED